MKYLAYYDMTPKQQRQVQEHLLTKTMTLQDLPKWKFLVNADGTVQRRKGMHQPTSETLAEFERMAAETRGLLMSQEVPGDPAKGSIRHYLSGARYNFGRG